MEQDDMIRMESFCMVYEVEPSLLHILEESGLLEIVHEQDVEFITAASLEQVDKLLRLHRELDINAEGLEAIAHLLQKISALQHEICRLQNRLSIYE
jgi:chaperone modulatory protein CbpM